MRKIIYVAGPYTSDTAWGVEKNCRAAEEISLKLWECGHVPVAPHLLSRFFYRSIDEDIVLSGLLSLLKKCDAMLLLPGWQDSPGTLKEIDFCNQNNIKIYLNLDEVIYDTDDDMSLQFPFV